MSSLSEGAHAEHLAVGLWGGDNLQLLSIPTLKTLSKEVLPNRLVPRSVLLVNMERVHYLMVALSTYILGFKYLRL